MRPGGRRYGIRLHGRRDLQEVLLLRAVLPDQGPAGTRRAGRNHRGLLHLLRLLRQCLLPGGEASRLLPAGRTGDPGRARSRSTLSWRLRSPRPFSTFRRKGWSARCRRPGSTACTRWPLAPTWWRRSTRAAFTSCCERSSEDFLISTPCPAVVQYVEKVLPELAPHLAGIVSPMEAMARVVRQKLHRQDEKGPAKLVFIGPCVAKKVEAWRVRRSGRRADLCRARRAL